MSLSSLYKGISSLKEKDLDIKTISRTEASKIKFPPSHPRKKVIYVGHPVKANVYYPVAEFHRKIFENKFNEAISLLVNLGAREVRVEHVTGWSKSFASKINAGVEVPNANVNIDGQGGFKKSKDDKLIFTAEYENNNKCSLPDNLIWYHHEPSWKQIADGRLNHKLKNFTLSVHYEDDFGVNVNFKSAVKKASLDLGGNFEKHQSTVWNIKGSF